MFNRENVGNRLKTIRQDRRVSQEYLAAASGVSVDSISRYETGANVMRLDTAVALSAALGVTLDQLVCREDYVCSEGE